ncbi:MAG: cupin domain-containing protein [Sulfolobaceae archaeon]|nr:cupin domain-containing protein [Sulfolobaceae archaeon]
MIIVNDHEPIHLIHLLAHREDFDMDAYYAKKGAWVAYLKRKAISEPQVVFTNFDQNKKFSESSFTPVQVYKTNSYAVILAYFKSGQYIPIHKPNIDVILFVKKGNGKVVAGDKEFEVKEGDLIVVPKGVKRGVLAYTEMELLHIVSPPPSPEDHKEVEEGLNKGRFKDDQH